MSRKILKIAKRFSFFSSYLNFETVFSLLLFSLIVQNQQSTSFHYTNYYFLTYFNITTNSIFFDLMTFSFFFSGGRKMLTKLNFLQKKILSLSVWITVSLWTWIFLFTFAWLLIAYSNFILKKLDPFIIGLFWVADLKFIKIHYGHYSYNPYGNTKSTRIIRKIYGAKIWASKDFATCLLDVT